MKSILSLLMLVGSMHALSAENMQTSQMDDLIRGEMAAIKSYDTVLSKIKDKNEKKQLEAIKNDHVQAVSKLKQFASAEVKEDTTSAGAWGSFASAYAGGAKLFGDKIALKALTQGEEHGVNEYKEALKDEAISADAKMMIKTQLLPKQEAHLKIFKSMM